jgi:hypothetical protein
MVLVFSSTALVISSFGWAIYRSPPPMIRSRTEASTVQNVDRSSEGIPPRKEAKPNRDDSAPAEQNEQLSASAKKEDVPLAPPNTPNERGQHSSSSEPSTQDNLALQAATPSELPGCSSVANASSAISSAAPGRNTLGTGESTRDEGNALGSRSAFARADQLNIPREDASSAATSSSDTAQTGRSRPSCDGHEAPAERIGMHLNRKEAAAQYGAALSSEAGPVNSQEFKSSKKRHRATVDIYGPGMHLKITCSRARCYY